MDSGEMVKVHAQDLQPWMKVKASKVHVKPIELMARTVGGGRRWWVKAEYRPPFIMAESLIESLVDDMLGYVEVVH
jgi:hypothetical protein